MRGVVPCLSADLTTHAVPHFALQALKMGRRARRDGLRGAVMSEVSGDAVRGFLACIFPGLVVAMTAATPQEQAAAAVPQMCVHRASVSTTLSALRRGADNEQWCCCRDDVSDNAPERQC